MANEDKFHGYLAAGRRERIQARQVAIYGYTTRGTLRKEPSTYANADRVEETITRMESLNPGKKFTTLEARKA